MREDHAAHLFVYDYMQDLTDWPDCITKWLEAKRELDQEVADALASVTDRPAAFWLTLAYMCARGIFYANYCRPCGRLGGRTR